MDHYNHLRGLLLHALAIHGIYADHIQAMVDSVNLDITESFATIKSSKNYDKIEEVIKAVRAKFADVRAGLDEIEEFRHVIRAGIASLHAQLDNILHELHAMETSSDQVVPVGCLHLYSDPSLDLPSMAEEPNLDFHH